jgi:acetyl-CoA carboxylase carboxyl transferase subunit alpha
MNPNFLDFEQPIADLQAKIEELRLVGNDNAINISDEIARLQEKSRALTESIFGNLSSWQIAKLARHPRRPYTLDYVQHIFTEFEELHGDRHFADDAAIVGGVARLDGQPVMVIGHQKGREVREKVRRNFGMPRPEGYRKACRLMEMAERFKLPILTFIDTPGAYPGIDAEERGQSEAIAWNLRVMARLKTPIISTVIGEGGSGGALAIGVCDQLNMLQYSTYAVISPEGCASILWRTAEKAPLRSLRPGAGGSRRAVAMGITAERLKELGIVDQVIPEPLGGAHADPAAAANTIREALLEQLTRLRKLDTEKLLARRYERLMSYGAP